MGKSAVTSERKVGVAALPLVGPLQILLAAWVANDPVNVPLVVIGLPETEKIPGNAKATEVTVPVVP